MFWAFAAATAKALFQTFLLVANDLQLEITLNGPGFRVKTTLEETVAKLLQQRAKKHRSCCTGSKLKPRLCRAFLSACERGDARCRNFRDRDFNLD
jgi:hypothetical protein